MQFCENKPTYNDHEVIEDEQTSDSKKVEDVVVKQDGVNQPINISPPAAIHECCSCALAQSKHEEHAFKDGRYE